jgi:hypothetical protein
MLLEIYAGYYYFGLIIQKNNNIQIPNKSQIKNSNNQTSLELVIWLLEFICDFPEGMPWQVLGI